ncbi:MAG: zinc-binding dehydrogenase [Nitrososphaerales archaeon]
MKSAQIKDGKLRIEELPIPSIASGDLLIEMKACGLCGSDIEKIRGQYDVSPIIGHEASGIVKEISADGTGIEKGDRVFPHHHVSCKSCHFCRTGSDTMCKSYREFHFDPGGFSEFFRVPQWNVKQGGILKLPANMSFDQASFIEPTGCCIRALRRSGIAKDDSLFVVGAGPIGLTVVQLAPLFGITKVAVSDINPKRLEFAKRCGASVTIDPTDDSISAAIMKGTKGIGVDCAIIASGNPSAVRQGLESIRRGGKVILLGIPPLGSSLDYGVERLVNNEVTMISTNAANDEEVRLALDFISKGQIDVDSMITHKFSIENIDVALEKIAEGDVIKSIIVP